MYQPLKGIKVVDFTLAAAGPSCTKQLKELGADIIWIEPLKGASTRAHHKYDFYCGGKRSLPVNLKSEKGMEVMYKLIDEADIFVTNYRLKAVNKLGLDYETLKARNPRLIYAAITGFGTEGAEANNPGTDTAAFWAKGGLLSDYAEKGTLCVAPSAFGDCATGMFLAGGVMAALYDREKTGKGCDLYTSLLGMAVYLNHHALVETQYGETYPKSRKAPAYALLNSYPCSDGWISLTVPRADFGKYFQPLMKAIGREDLADSPDYPDVSSVCGDKAAAFVAILDEAFSKMTTADAVAALQAINIPVDRVQTTADTLKDAQILENKMIYPLEATKPIPGGPKEIMVPANPIKFQKDLDFGIEGQVRGPKLGEQTTEILKELGYSQEEIAAMISENVTVQAE